MCTLCITRINAASCIAISSPPTPPYAGQPHITDFGLAKKVEGDSGKFDYLCAIVGTPSYMPPEQVRGEKGLTVAADIYSLGAILYECLTGRPPFRSDTALKYFRPVQHEPACAVPRRSERAAIWKPSV